MLKNLTKHQKLAPAQNSIVSNTVREGITFAFEIFPQIIIKSSSHSEIAIPVSPASIQQSLTLSPENFPLLQNSNNLNFSIPNTENLDIIINKLKEIETVLNNIIKLAKNSAIPLDFPKGLLNVKF